MLFLVVIMPVRDTCRVHIFYLCTALVVIMPVRGACRVHIKTAATTGRSLRRI